MGQLNLPLNAPQSLLECDKRSFVGSPSISKDDLKKISSKARTLLGAPGLTTRSTDTTKVELPHSVAPGEP